MQRPRGLSRVALIILALLAFMVASILTGWFQVRPPEGGPFTVTIPEHADAQTAAVILENAGVIRSSEALVWVIKRRGSAVKPGRYVFNTGLYPWTAARYLARGVPALREITVTIPEGKRLPEIAAILEKAGVCDADEFLMAAHDPRIVRNLIGESVSSLEGYLFPDTYKFASEEDPVRVLHKLHDRFREQVEGLERPGMTRHQFVTLASIVEREARVGAERPIIAAVFLNRLAKGMRLEADPTVRYALGRWDTSPVLYRDLAVESPYNTYRVFGLPPGPIAAPGRASLEAVANPADTNVLFFVARPDGSHAFSPTFSGHRANIGTWR